MHNEKDDIEQLFSKKFEKFEVKSSEEEWLKLNSKLSKVNFLKFSFVTFNVYYLMIMVAFAGSATFTGIRNIQLSEKIQELEHSSQTYQVKDKPSIDSAELINSADAQKTIPEYSKPIENVGIKTEAKKKPEPEIKKLDNTAAVKEEPTTQNQLEEKVDDINSVKAVPPDTTRKTLIRKVVKKTYVLKPRTIIVKDTVEVTKFKK